MLERFHLGKDNEKTQNLQIVLPIWTILTVVTTPMILIMKIIPNTCNTTFVLVCVFFIYFKSISNIYTNKSCSFFVIESDGEQPSTT